MTKNHSPLPAENLIASAWQRCQASGLKVGEAAPEKVSNPAALAASLEQNAHLVAYAQPLIEELRPHLVCSLSLVVLADRQGLILRCAGDQHFLEQARQIHLQPGVVWSESVMGSNAIGTALAEKRSVTISGPQHFYTRHHALAGIATPIAAPTGGIAGVLAIFSDAQVAQTHAPALLELNATNIENRLVENTTKGTVLLRLHTSPAALGSPLEGLAVWNSEGCLLAWNRRFQQAIPCELHVGLAFVHIFSLSWAALLGHGKQPDQLLPLNPLHGEPCQARVDLRRMATFSDTQIAPRRPPGARQLAELGSEDPRMAIAIRRASRIAGIDIPLLIEGETGSGKEWFAQAFHQASERRHGPFVAVNCAAIPASLIEAELFGYLDGAFTGARRLGSTGKIREADGGTLFLDEIGDMPLALQAVLLRVLETRKVVPLGGKEETAVNIALVCASHHPLQKLVSNGQFRADLFFRLSGMTVALPALRERSDFDRIVRNILAEEAPGQRIELPAETWMLLRRYAWPGNLRQLRNVLRLCVAMMGDTTLLSSDFLPGEIVDRDTAIQRDNHGLRAVQERAIQHALQRNAGNISATARELGITRTTLYRKLSKEKTAGTVL